MTEEDILLDGYLSIDTDSYKEFGRLLSLRPNYMNQWIDYAIFEEKSKALKYCIYISKEQLRCAFDTGNKELIMEASVLALDDEIQDSIKESIDNGDYQYEEFLRSLIET